jgi:hypothetical protein
VHCLRPCLPAALLFLALPAVAAPFTFSTGGPDGAIATLSQPGTGGPETETAEDFLLGQPTRLATASFTGLITGSLPVIGPVTAEIYRVFPKDSTVPPSGAVPTRVNSPSDVALTSRTGSGELAVTTTLLAPLVTAANSVVSGINKVPNQKTLGEGPVSGQEVRFDLTFTLPIDLPADHYFFVPQVQVTDGKFLWLSAPKPIVAPGTPFTPDLQTWIRNESLAPDWLRIGTDITGSGPFNASFSLAGETLPAEVPEPASLLVLTAGLAGLGLIGRKRS